MATGQGPAVFMARNYLAAINAILSQVTQPRRPTWTKGGTHEHRPYIDSN